MILKKINEIKDDIEQLGGILISKEYINNSQPLKLKCPDCGEDFERSYSNIQQRKSIVCKSCSYKYRNRDKISKKELEVKKYIENLGGIFLKYNGARKPLELKCTDCGEQFTKTLQAIKLSGFVTCQDCVTKEKVKKMRTDISLIREFIEELGGELISNEFIHSCENLIIKCNKCKDEFHRTWKYIKDKENVTCPKCSNTVSLGAEKIIKLLNDNKVEHIMEKTFEGCVDVGKLRFDFYLPHINTCIEYDGKQHFFPYNDFGGVSSFEDRVKKDEIKNNFCIENNINLLRISYKDFKRIEEILREHKIIPSEAS